MPNRLFERLPHQFARITQRIELLAPDTQSLLAALDIASCECIGPGPDYLSLDELGSDGERLVANVLALNRHDIYIKMKAGYVGKTRQTSNRMIS